MDANQIRRTFIDFFVARDHVHRPSASLIPVDPTLLLTGAGMVPFKPYFLGQEPPPFPRAVSVQKCARTTDIEIIGTTLRHFSFFEMLGNFSFGDYFKEKAIPWAYELVTEGFGLDPERLWFTVYKTDDEAAQIWIDQVGVPADRVQRGDDEDNFWQMGVPGPCGPDSEIFWDKGGDFGDWGGPLVGGQERYVEIWNLVFMQNIQDDPFHVVGDLPAKNIDTGMGLERMAAVLQNKESVFDVDTVAAVIRAASAYSGVAYGSHSGSDVSLRIMADHGRMVTFLVGDGVVPSNEGRGYVLRRLIRRAVRHAFSLGGEGLVFPKLVEATIEVMSEAYPQLKERENHIVELTSREESRFRRTLESGHQLLDAELEHLTEAGVVAGPTAFKLHDTYGFPIELTEEIAGERGHMVDRAGFEHEMAAQRERARRAWKGGDQAATAELYRRLLDEIGPTDFVGYNLEAAPARVLALLAEGEQIERAGEGRMVEVFLDRTPFYGESGGQVGDRGTMTSATGLVEVEDTRHALQGFHGHRAVVRSGEILVGQDVETAIDSPRREKIRKSHTGTHVLHWSLRQVLGDHAHQAGSLVEAGRLRFDFSHYSALAAPELSEVERLANLRLIENHPVTTTVTSREQAEEMGALAFFGDKYGERVRVVKVGEFSVEFCGGTHTHTAGQVGPLIVLGESSIGSNLRRVEALSGENAYDHLVDLRTRLAEAGLLLRVSPADVPARVRGLLERLEEMQGRMQSIEASQRSEVAAELAAGAVLVGEARLVVAARFDQTPEQLRQLALDVRSRLDRGLVILGSTTNGKGALVGAATPNLVSSGISAAEVVGPAARLLGGGSSRDPELSQAGGPQGDQLQAALDQARETAEAMLAGL